MSAGERGAALLEALVALMLLSLAGVSAVELVGSAARSERSMRIAELRMREADRLLTAYSLLTGTELDQRVGTQRHGTLAVLVQRPERRLYRLAVVDTLWPKQELLVTVVYREEPR